MMSLRLAITISLALLVALPTALGQTATTAAPECPELKAVLPGDTVKLTGPSPPSGEYAYLWTINPPDVTIPNPSAKDLSFTVPKDTKAASYTVTLMVTSVRGGCIQTSCGSITVKQPQIPCVIAAEKDPICVSETGVYTLSGPELKTGDIINWFLDGKNVPGPDQHDKVLKLEGAAIKAGKHVVKAEIRSGNVVVCSAELTVEVLPLPSAKITVV